MASARLELEDEMAELERFGGGGGGPFFFWRRAKDWVWLRLAFLSWLRTEWLRLTRWVTVAYFSPSALETEEP